MSPQRFIFAKSIFVIDMSTYREIVYMVNDELKLSSDDSFYTLDHIRFLVGKYRSYLLKKYYSDIRKEIPESNYQEICVDLELKNPDNCSGMDWLESTQEIPAMMTVGNPMVISSGLMGNNFSMVSYRRFLNVGHNRFLKNIIYATRSPENKLLLTSSNPQYRYLEKVKMFGLFEDPAKASALSCEESSGDVCKDILDMDFPLEEALIPLLIQLVVKELSGSLYQPKDDENNAGDDLSEINTAIQRNLKSPLQKSLQNGATLE